MKFETIFKVLVLFCCICFLHAYPNGAPSIACQSMTPQHNETAPQNRAKPYTVTLNSTYYTARENVLVTLKGVNRATFKGFLMEMRRSDSQLTVGTFSISTDGKSKLIQCNNINGAAITHTDNDTKTEILVTWTPPSQSVGNIRIAATVVQDFHTFWNNIQSAALTESTPSTSPSPAPTGQRQSTGSDNRTSASQTLAGYIGLLGAMFAMLLVFT